MHGQRALGYHDRNSAPLMVLSEGAIVSSLDYADSLVPLALLPMVWATSRTARLPAPPGGVAAGGTIKSKIQSAVYLSPVWAIITGLTCNMHDAQSSRDFISAWLASKRCLDPYCSSQDLDGGRPEKQLEPDDAILIGKLREREEEIREGAGRLFRVRTQVSLSFEGTFFTSSDQVLS